MFDSCLKLSRVHSLRIKLAVALALVLVACLPGVASAGSVTSVAVGTQPLKIALNPITNMVYASNYGSGDVSAIDGATGEVVGSYPVGTNPYSLAVDSVRNKLFVANLGDFYYGTTVSAIDLTTGITTTITVGTGPMDVVVDELAGRAYVASFRGHNVTVIDAETSLVTTTVAVGRFPNAIALNASTGKVYTTDQDSNTVTVIDAASGFATASVSVGSSPRAVDVNQTTGEVYACDGGGISVIDGATNVRTRGVTAGSTSQAVAADEKTGKVYVANQTSGNVTVIDVAGGYTTKQVDTGSGSNPYAIGINEALGRVYVPCQYKDKVVVLHAATDEILESVAVGGMPSAIAVNETTRYVYTPNYTGNNVSFFETSLPQFRLAFVTDGTPDAWLSSDAQMVDEGASAGEVYAFAPAYYHLAYWTGTGGFASTTDNPLTVVGVTQDATYTAHFALDTCILTYSAAEGGSIEGSTTQEFPLGSSATTVTAVGDSGYHFVQWIDRNNIDNYSTDPVRVDTNVWNSADYEAQFAPDYSYYISGGEAYIYGYSGTGTSTVAPSMFEDCPVVSVATGTFANHTELIRATLPDTVRYIGAQAFYGCTSLVAFDLPANLVTLEYEAFRGCTSLESMEFTIPDAAVGPWALAECSALTSVTMPADWAGIPRGTFQNCSSLTTITIPSSVSRIGEQAFYGCSGLTRIDVPAGLTQIEAFAFQLCSSLERFEIPSGVHGVGQYAFAGCSSMTSITVPADWESLSNGIFESCSSLTIAPLPPGLKSIGDTAFGNCTGLTHVEIPATVNSLGWYCFDYCTGLTTVTVPPSVTSIPGAAFMGCSGLKTVTLPPSVTYIGWAAFASCTGMESIDLPSGLTGVGNFAFSGSGLKSLTLPAGVQTASNGMCQSCDNLKSVTLPSGVTHVVAYAFSNCANLESVTIPASVTNLEGETFSYCPKLTSAYFLGNAPASVGRNIFERSAPRFVVTIRPNATGFGPPVPGPWVPTGNPAYGSYPTGFATFTVNYVSGAGGSIEGSATQAVEDGLSGIEVTASPSPGFKFLKWSDESTANPRIDTNVTADATYIASFALDLASNPDTFAAQANEVTTVTAPGVLANDSAVTSVEIVADAGHGHVTLTADGGFVYTPDTNYAGADTFTYRATDGSEWTSPVTVTLLVAPRTLETIEGTITAGGNGLNHIVVTAFDATTDLWEASVFTDANGHYTMRVLNGYHHIRFTRAADGVLAEGLEQYYQHVKKIVDAQVVRNHIGERLVLSDDLTPLVNPTASITGTVTASGTPLDHIVVTAYDATTHRDVKGVFTNAAGGYSITGIPAGTYHVRFGVTSPASMTQYFDHAVPITGASVLTLTTGGTLTVSSDLAPEAPLTTQTISGTVTNSEVPMNRIVVTAFNAATHAYVRGVFTNALGAYTLALPAGDYHLRFTGMTPSGLTQYYDHQNRISNAAILELGSGAALTVTTDLSGTITP
ncbi:MAG: leucine-rich repeat protein [Coriobacteriia bacterium]|nr:leucine-rich repeat protein [Coriobacteriia bacterium]